MAAPPPLPPPPPPRVGLSLYDNLHDPNDASTSSATISSAPVRYDRPPAGSSENTAKKPVDPALLFQPIRRPQTKAAKPKAGFPKTIPSTSTIPSTTAAPQPQKNTLAEWAATEDDEWKYGPTEKHQRGGRKKKKRKQQEFLETNWDDIYDPSRPTDLEEYLRSDEKVAEIREWKTLLYRHRKLPPDSDVSSDNDDTRPSALSKSLRDIPNYSRQTDHCRSICASSLIRLCSTPNLSSCSCRG